MSGESAVAGLRALAVTVGGTCGVGGGGALDGGGTAGVAALVTRHEGVDLAQLPHRRVVRVDQLLHLRQPHDRVGVGVEERAATGAHAGQHQRRHAAQRLREEVPDEEAEDEGVQHQRHGADDVEDAGAAQVRYAGDGGVAACDDQRNDEAALGGIGVGGDRGCGPVVLEVGVGPVSLDDQLCEVDVLQRRAHERVADLAHLEVANDRISVDGVDAVVADGLLPPRVGQHERVIAGERLVDEGDNGETGELEVVVVDQQLRAVEAHLCEVRVAALTDAVEMTREYAQREGVAQEVRHRCREHPVQSRVHIADAAVEERRQDCKDGEGGVGVVDHVTHVAKRRRPLVHYSKRSSEGVGGVVDEVTAVDGVFVTGKAGECVQRRHVDHPVHAGDGAGLVDGHHQQRTHVRGRVVVVQGGAEAREKGERVNFSVPGDAERQHDCADLLRAIRHGGDAGGDGIDTSQVNRVPHASESACHEHLRDG
ncbi:hypothetical protein NESM_000914000 [Novymonas esmeraldas]|uniref:Uncharacterized protein n=1 Tax=Novymonas esmeraldas TaxID=1808958 RepID=A0AAW0F0T2_9TRYP